MALPASPRKSTRRSFLARAAVGLAAIGTASSTSGAVATKEPSILVDAHLHCFAGPADPRFPYHERAPYRPGETASPERLLDCMREGGVGFAVVVHPEPYQDDHRYLEHCLELGKGRLKGTCLFFADRPGSIERMRQLARRTPLVAARVHAYAPDRLPPFGSAELRALWKAAGDLGLAIQLHFEPRYAPGFEPLVREFPTTRVLIDHLGRPFQGTPEEHQTVLRWARYDHAYIKLSGIPSPLTYPHRDPAKVIRQLADAFGADRMIYGGGFGAQATGASYRAAFESARRHLAHLDPADQAKVLGGNAVRLFGFRAA